MNTADHAETAAIAAAAAAGADLCQNHPELLSVAITLIWRRTGDNGLPATYEAVAGKSQISPGELYTLCLAALLRVNHYVSAYRDVLAGLDMQAEELVQRIKAVIKEDPHCDADKEKDS